MPRHQPGPGGSPAAYQEHRLRTARIPVSYTHLPENDRCEDGMLIIDGLRYHLHPTHLCLKESLAAIAAIRPRRAVLTLSLIHISQAVFLIGGLATAGAGLVARHMEEV